MAQIVEMIVNRFVEQLTTSCITQVPSSDASRANLVKAWRFQDSPLEHQIAIWVVAGNPGTLDYRDGWIGTNSIDDLGLRIPAGEVGGGHLWWRRGMIQLNCSFIIKRLTERDAAIAAFRVLGRVMHNIERAQVADLEDEFGERAIRSYVFGSNFFQGGGPEKQYFWRGDVLWQVLTERPY